MIQHVGTRLRSARKMAGMTLQELAEQISVSKQTVGYYEQGKVIPPSTTLIALARVLDVKPDYFFRPETLHLEKIEFRKEHTLSKKEEQRIRHETLAHLERYAELETLLGITTHCKIKIHDVPISSQDSIEEAAQNFRQNFSLGNYPIRSIVEFLEEQGIRVVALQAEEDFVGMSGICKPNDYPVIVLNTKGDIVRKRLTALHELAHLILQFPPDMPARDIERACHNFAAAVLVPKEMLIKELGAKRSRVTLSELVHLKRYYGISVQAVEMRSHKLGIISDASHRAFWQYVNAQEGGKRIDPGKEEYQEMEEPTQFHSLLIRAAAEGIISESKAASLANMSLAEFSDKMQWQ